MRSLRQPLLEPLAEALVTGHLDPRGRQKVVDVGRSLNFECLTLDSKGG